MAMEDLYLPYRPAEDTGNITKGLEPLANLVLMQLTKTPLLKRRIKAENSDCGGKP